MSVVSTAGDLIEVRVCPVCRSSVNSLFESFEEGDRTVTYRLCNNCGSVFQSPRMSELALEAYYEADYVTEHQHAIGVTDKELRIQAGRARHLTGVLRRHVDSAHRHLDIGCSTGSLMVAVRKAYGCESIGVEPAGVYRSYSAARGLTVFADLKGVFEAGNRQFDLITMAHLLEHLPKPVDYLQELREAWLAPDSTLLIEVPNLYGHRSVEIPHLFCFSAGTLRYTLSRAGYEIVGMSRHGAPRSRVIPLYLTAIAKPLPVGHEVRPSKTKAVRFRRTLGMAWHRLATRLLPGWAWLPLPSLDEAN